MFTLSAVAPERDVDAVCPDWAFDPWNREERPRTWKWQPIWDPVPRRQPLTGNERLLAEVLDLLGVEWLYEPLLVPIYIPHATWRRQRGLPERRWLRSDFLLPEEKVILEEYSGLSQSTYDMKVRRLTRMRRLHGIPFMVVTTAHLITLETDPTLLRAWIDDAKRPQLLAA